MCPKKLATLMTFLVPAALLAADRARMQVDIALVGVVPAAQAPRDGSIWLGLFQAEDGYELRASRVTLAKPEWGNTVDDVAYKELATEDDTQPLALFSVAPSLHPGAVPTAHAGVAYMAPGARLDLTLDGDRYRLAAGKLPVSPAAAAEAALEETEPPQLCGITLAHGSDVQLVERVPCYGDFSISQPLASMGAPMVLWAGDLDGDGRLDVIMAGDQELPDGSYESGLRLYLSSLAGPGQLVGLAGETAIDLSYGC